MPAFDIWCYRIYSTTNADILKEPYTSASEVDKPFGSFLDIQRYMGTRSMVFLYLLLQEMTA